MVIYEHPLNEKIRLFLRMKTLSERFEFHMQELNKPNSHAAVMILIELYNLSSRLDIKSAMLSMLDWQSQVLKSYSNIEEDDAERIRLILNKLDDRSSTLYGYRGQLGQDLKTNNFIGILLQRSVISGGVNGLDIPLFNHWLSKTEEKRREELLTWVEPYKIAQESIHIILELINGAYDEKIAIAENGYYQETLSPDKEYQLLRVSIDAAVDYYPEVSAGKQRFTIRFVDTKDLKEKGKQIVENVEFKLALCHL